MGKEVLRFKYGYTVNASDKVANKNEATEVKINPQKHDPWE